MPRDPEAFADMVVMTVKAALAPVLERLGAAEQQNKDLQARVVELSGLRDRLTAVETKAAFPTVPVPLGPTEAEIQILLRDRLEPVTKQLDGLSGRVDAVERRPEPQPVPAVAVATGPTMAEMELSLRDRMDPLTKQIAGLSERVAVIEVRAPIPGPAGQDGKDGANGKDGAAGLGFDDMDVEFDGDRTVLLKFVRDAQTKSWPITLPYLRYQGVFTEGKQYAEGDVVTWAGHAWHCKEATTVKPDALPPMVNGEPRGPNGARYWTMLVRKGDAGKQGPPGTPAPTATPVVSVGVGR